MRSSLIRISSALIVTAAVTLAATPCAAALTFHGIVGSATTGRVVAGWGTETGPDSLVSTFGLVPGALVAGATLSSAAHSPYGTTWGVQGAANLQLAAAGAADQWAPVAQCGLWVNDVGYFDSPTRWVQSTLGLTLSVESDQPRIFWAIVDNSNYGNPPPGPPGRAYLTTPPPYACLSGSGCDWRVTMGDMPNTGTLDLGAVIEAVRADGQAAQWYDSWSLEVYVDDHVMTRFTTGVPVSVPPMVTFAPPWPNPARGGVVFDFTLPYAARVRLEVADVAGRHVATVTDDVYGPAPHGVRWDAKADDGSAVAAGVYYARMLIEGRTIVRRFALLP